MGGWIFRQTDRYKQRESETERNAGQYIGRAWAGCGTSLAMLGGSGVGWGGVGGGEKEERE